MTEQTTLERKRAYDPVKMRERLLDVAAGAFQSRGYHPTSMHDIMQAAGVTGGALYHHFPTKKALGLAVVRERVAKAIAETWIEPVRSARTASDGILAVFDRVIAELDERGAVSGCPLGNLAVELSLADPDFRIAVQGVFERWRIAIAQRLRSDRTARAVKGLDPEGFATFVVASFSGAMALAKAGQDTGPLKACARQLARAMRPRRRVSGGADRGRPESGARARLDTATRTPASRGRPAEVERRVGRHPVDAMTPGPSGTARRRKR